MIFRVKVGWSTHDLLQEGVCTAGTHQVKVAAATAWEAECIAAQMVACHDLMPTSTAIVQPRNAPAIIRRRLTRRSH
jgi:hypothetical protein